MHKFFFLGVCAAAHRAGLEAVTGAEDGVELADHCRRCAQEGAIVVQLDLHTHEHTSRQHVTLRTQKTKPHSRKTSPLSLSTPNPAPPHTPRPSTLPPGAGSVVWCGVWRVWCGGRLGGVGG